MKTLVSPAWARRGRRALLAAMLAGAVLIPGRIASEAVPACHGRHCQPVATARVRWSRVLPGAWTAQAGYAGTGPAAGEAYASAGSGLAVAGFGQTVEAWDLQSGQPLWGAGPAALAARPGAVVASVRSWPGVVTVGLQDPAAAGRAASRTELVLSAQDGKVLRRLPAAPYGGAVAAGAARTVVIGPHAVVSYRNATGRPAWRRAAAGGAAAWQVSGGYLDLAVTARRGPQAGQVTALRRISLTSGAQQVLRPPGRAFAGSLSGAVAGVVLFSGPGGLTGYSSVTGKRLWFRAGVVPSALDASRQLLYVTSAGALIGLDPATGAKIARSRVPGASAIYGVAGGVAVGLDLGSLGDAWGYSVTRHRVVWTTMPLPWPHFFTGLSGLPGGDDPATGIFLLTTCASLGSGTGNGSAQPCQRPELAAVGH